MSKTINLIIGACALGAVASAGQPDASAQTWTPSVGPSNYYIWKDGDVAAAISNTATSSIFGTWPQHGLNTHTGGWYVDCTNETTAWYGGFAWSDGNWRGDEHYCLSQHTITQAYGYVWDY